MNLDSNFLKSLGVIDWGYTSNIEPISFENYDHWVKRENHGILNYLSDHRMQARRSLTSVYEECESALVFLFSYHPQKLALEKVYQNPSWNGLKLGSYVLGFEGQDYHHELKRRLVQIAQQLRTTGFEFDFKMALDIHPVLERDLAYRCGLGWFGKNSMLISKTHGSYTIIGTLLLNKKINLSVKSMETDHCGKCRACIDTCPTKAIDPLKRTIIADKCISTFTIELFKEGEPPAGMEQANGEFFGCDICQEVCPWNQRPIRTKKVSAQSMDSFSTSNKMILNDFLLRPLSEIESELESMSNNKFFKTYKATPLGRTGRKGILKNLRFWKLVKKS